MYTYDYCIAELFLEWALFQTKVVETIKTHFVSSNSPPPQIRAVYEVMLKNMVEPDRPKMTV